MKISELDQIQEWKDSFIEFSKNPVGFLLMAGKNGTGKTFASRAIFDAIKVGGFEDKYFFTQTDLNHKYISEMKKFGCVIHWIEEYSKAKILVIDDLGTRSPTEAFKDFLYAIIEKREKNKQNIGTIITTNLNANQMREIFGDAIVSRIASDRVFRFEGKDRRFNQF